MTVNELIRIASFGGGFVISAKDYLVNDLVRIVSFMQSKAQITIRDAGMLSSNDLVRISSFSRGSVVFQLM